MLVPKPLAKVTKPIINHYSDVIAVASEAVAEYFFDDRNETEVLYSQVDTKRFSSTAISDNKVESLRAELDINNEMRVVGTVGNVSPNKAHDVLIQAIPSILKQHPKTVFVIVGSNLGSQSNYYQLLLQEAENLGVSSQIIFTGFRTDIPAILSLFDIFVFPSRSEACPQSVLEAMSMETPVVASRTGGIVEQIEQSKDGLLIPTDNPDALSKAINNLLSSPQKCERLGKHARQTVVNRFSIQQCVDRHKNLYDMTLS
jgi:glycosyltransferase involved in cell wall biosynthesis